MVPAGGTSTEGTERAERYAGGEGRPRACASAGPIFRHCNASMGQSSVVAPRARGRRPERPTSNGGWGRGRDPQRLAGAVRARRVAGGGMPGLGTGDRVGRLLPLRKRPPPYSTSLRPGAQPTSPLPFLPPPPPVRRRIDSHPLPPLPPLPTPTPAPTPCSPMNPTYIPPPPSAP